MLAIDVPECPECAGRLEVVAFIAEAAVARRELNRSTQGSSSDTKRRREVLPPPMALTEPAWAGY